MHKHKFTVILISRRRSSPPTDHHHHQKTTNEQHLTRFVCPTRKRITIQSTGMEQEAGGEGTRPQGPSTSHSAGKRSLSGVSWAEQSSERRLLVKGARPNIIQCPLKWDYIKTFSCSCYIAQFSSVLFLSIWADLTILKFKLELIFKLTIL